MTYATLQADIASYMHRTDLTAKIPGFIALAESTLFRELGLKEMDVSVTGTSSGAIIALPSDFDSLSRLTITANGVEKNLDYIARPDDYASGSAPIGYSQESNQLRLFQASDQAYTLYYTATIPALGASVATNWLLDNAPDLYLYASALEAAKWTRDDDHLNKLMGIVPPLLDSVRRLSERRAKPSRANLQIKPRR